MSSWTGWWKEKLGIGIFVLRSTTAATYALQRFDNWIERKWMPPFHRCIKGSFGYLFRLHSILAFFPSLFSLPICEPPICCPYFLSHPMCSRTEPKPVIRLEPSAIPSRYARTLVQNLSPALHAKSKSHVEEQTVEWINSFVRRKTWHIASSINLKVHLNDYISRLAYRFKVTCWGVGRVYWLLSALAVIACLCV